ncbi:putative transporter MCH2 [Zancudomyces culisetae]|uniref:Putative transporter MCH2 n=1 Tax=Zancudomyces culisetae TaxID=1213189 RepID=A0A1R1PWB3_ZANCU|nr:putative transporter MCH2 [Zancudomyces culisetae]|eukprot:OMH85276.1 putative transporter MCH2 [Zancudomyces culisetae]
MTGIGASIVVNVSLTVVSSWFVKKRAFALSIMSAAGGLGGVILVPIVSATLSGLGIRWAFIILGIINITATTIGAVFMRLRSEKFKPSKNILNFKLLKDLPFVSLVFACMFMNSGQYATTLYYPASVIDLGYSNSLGYYTVMIYCGCIAIFRVFMSFFLHRVNPIFFTAVAQFIAIASIMALWYPSKSLVVHIIFFVIFSLTSSTIYGVSTVVNATRFKPETVGQANGLAFIFFGFGLLIGNPLTGLIFDTLGHRTNYHPVMIFNRNPEYRTEKVPRNVI